MGDPNDKASPDLKAGPELNAAVAVEVFGWKPANPTHYLGSPIGNMKGPWYAPPGEEQSADAFWPDGYSTDIAAAWLVVEKMREKDWELLLESPGFEQSVWVATWSHVGEPWAQESYRGQTAPEAICNAALSAVRAGKDAT